MARTAPIGGPRPNPIDVQVGKRIALARAESGLDRERFAQLAGVSVEQIALFESGEDRVSVTALFSISRHLQLPISYFFEL